MTSKRFVASVAAIALLAELLFPPFDLRTAASAEAVINVGFGFLFAPPVYRERVATVNVDLLALELLVTFAIGWLCIRFIAKD